MGDVDLDQLKQRALELLKDKRLKRIHVVARQGGERGFFVAPPVPGCGWRCFEPVSTAAEPVDPELSISPRGLENCYYRLTFRPDGTFDLLDKETGVLLEKQHRLVDGADRGDLYTFDAPEKDVLIETPAYCGLRRVKVEILERGPVRATARLTRQVYRLPAS